MHCASCGHANPEAARFCNACGAAFAPRCSACGADNAPGARFCNACGASLVAQPARPADKADTRKVVTIIFADLIGSTSMHERLDPESVTRLMERYYRAMRGAVETHGGTVVKLMGDGVMAAFGVPRVAEDDAIRAVRAGVAMQDAFRELARKEFAAVGAIGLRVGINTGEVVVSADNTDVVGDPVNVAARLQTEAHDGEVVIGESTRRLVAALVTLAPLGSFALKGRAEAMRAYRVESLDRPVGTTTAAFVGRDDELARITALYEAVLATPASRLAVLLGSPGLGKSRLIEEVTRRLGPSAEGFGPQAGDTARVVTAHCDAAGGATFAPLAAALREFLLQAAQTSPAPAQGVALGSRLAALSGLSPAHSTENQQPQRGDQPVAGGNAPGGGGAARDLRAALEAAVPATDGERTRIIDGITALLAGSPASPEETFFIIRRFLAALAATRPVVLVIDDLQWAEPLLLDLVEHLVQWGSGVPLLVLVGARPELRDLRSSLVTPGGLVSDVVTLSGLDAGAAMRLAANVIGAADLPAAVAAKVLATSEGNPLFVGELVRMLVDEQAIERQGERWIVGANLAALEMPPTIHALLAARIERLRPEERTVLERAAVVGRHFSRSAVAALLGRNGGELDARLEALRRTELIERDTGWFLGEPVLRFHHVLIRDAAYRRLLKGTRAELHERLADWIEAQVADAPEHDETIGWHLEQAHQHLRELGPLDANGKGLGERAAKRLAAAGGRALAGDDVALAASLLGRAIEGLDRDDPGRADLALDWCEALLAAGDVGTAVKAIDELGRHAHLGEEAVKRLAVTRLGDDPSATVPVPLTANSLTANRRLSAWHTCFTGQLTVLTAPQALHTTADAVAGAAEALGALGDAAGEAKGHFVHALALARLGKVGACEAALDRALAAARRAGDRRRANTVLAIAPLAALWGPSPVTRASGRCLDVVRVLRITQGAPAVEAVALSCQAVLEALRGRTDAARRMIASSRKMVEELGITQRLLEADVFGGLIDLLEGDAVAAERSLRGAYEGLRDLGLGIDAARAAALLARALLAQGRVAEAEALSHESEALAGDDLKAAIAWRGVRAEALARRGKHAAAVELASKAVEIAAATDALLDHADARLALATVLRAAGRSAEAAAEERRAIELWEAKGATLLAERTRRDVPPVALAVRAPERETKVPQVRRVRANAATASAARVPVAFAARDLDALAAQLADGMETLHHPTGLVYDREGALASFRSSMRGPGARFENEPIAALGDSLVLCHQTASASATGGATFDVGAYERRELALIESAAEGRIGRVEIFAADYLGDAIVRLYERYAELLPEGPARTRATATAGSVAVIAGKFDIDRLAAVIAPDIQVADHRNVGFGAVSGAEALLHAVRALTRNLSEGFDWRVDDVFGLHPDALVVRHTSSGTDRRSGGAFERSLCELFVFGADGRIARWERFDLDHLDEALARFDALTAHARHAGSLQAGIQEGGVDSRQTIAGKTERSQPAIGRRVQLNEVTAFWARFDAVFAARDANAIDASFSDSFAEIDHTTGASYGRDGALASIRRLLRAPDPEFRHEALATLGPSLGLVRGLISASGTGGGRFDVGAYEIEEIKVTEVNQQRRLRAAEVFAGDHLGDAVARLYERYAELLPDGPARTRAAATARSVAAMLGPYNPDRYATALAPALEVVDHRTLGTWSAHGAEAFLQHFRAMIELADEPFMREDEILSLQSDALLVRRTHCGTGRAAGGAYERPFIDLLVFGTDGLLTRLECFDADRDAEALARFDELARSNPPSPFPTREGGRGSLTSLPVSGRDRGRGSLPEPVANAASRADRRLFDCFNMRDWAGVEALAAPELVFDERRRMLHNTCGREIWLEQFRVLFDVPASRFTTKLLATRGERLSLSLHCFAGEVAGGGGPLEMDDHLVLHEVDRAGRIVAIVLFDLEDQDAAYAELDRRFEVSEAVAHLPSWESMRGFVRAVASRDWDAVAALCAESLVEYDHRRLAVIGTTHGAEAWARNFSTLADLSPDTVYRVDHFRAGARGYSSHGGWHGTREGGPYEMPLNAVLELDARGRIVRADIYDDDGVEAALARFAELAPTSGTSPQHFANAATRAVDRGTAALAARDWEGFAALFATDFRHDDRTRMAQLESDGQQWLASFRQIVEMTSSRPTQQVLATRGDRLALFRMLWRGAQGDIGPSEIDWLLIVEANGRGDHVAVVDFDPDDLDAAYAEIDARWAAGEAAAHPLASKWLADYLRFFAARDWNAMTTLFAPELVGENHRLVGWGTLHGPGAIVSTLQAQIELAPDTQERVDHVRSCEHAVLFEYAWHGTHAGGAFENLWIVLVELDVDGRGRRADVWEAEQIERALTRFAEIAAQPNPLAPFFTREGGMEPLSTSLPASGRDRGRGLLRIPPNAATRAYDRWYETVKAGNWDALDALYGASYVFDDRRRLFRETHGRAEGAINTRFLFEGGWRPVRTLLATAGDRLALQRIVWTTSEAGAVSEIEVLELGELDGEGRFVQVVLFDPDDRAAASAELFERWVASRADAVPAALVEYLRAWNDHDLERLGSATPGDFVVYDRRRTGIGRIDRDGNIASLAALWDLSRDVRIEPLYEVAAAPHGLLVVNHWFGTNAEGGDFETVYVALVHIERERFAALELFEIDDLEAARARFEELCAARAT